MNVLLSGIVGSTAYGLATNESDVDTLGVYACDTRELHGLKEVVETHVTVNPDATHHEARKYCRLALRCNPTVTELMWLDNYIEAETLGIVLVTLRDRFLSQRLVRDSYLGYASAQFRRLEQRGDGSFSADTRKRTAKHARHLLRLLHQGAQLYSEGELRIKVVDPELYHEFGERVADGDIDAARRKLGWAEGVFDSAKPAIPEVPDTAIVERWLHEVRRQVWNEH